ncbi:MAG: inositol 2-dehydrogenase [Proteobacteria bacterium]|jgi:myo-inositol 2-dehydrogenase/D-chiro-inositol 1-dehydrogenase|nr:inositol 2-dehydrogenase [Pseudomonadota bacterium]MDA0994698.1 inositol 2-dehydrogenase [Pseudomonadota bacterium]
MIRIAIIGAGRIGQIHAANLVQNVNAEVVYISDVIESAAVSLASRCSATVVSVDHLMNDASVDAVVIASSTDTHADLVEQAAAAGKSIFCEKPLDLSSERAAACISVAEKHGVLLSIGFNRRHDPSFSRLKNEIDAGTIGNVEVVSITSRDPSPPPVEYLKRSGGLFRDMMIHDFDMGRWLLGEEPNQVFAIGSVMSDPRIKAAADIDTAIAILKTASGRMCQITNSRRCDYGYDQRIEVFGSKGMVRADNQTKTKVEVASASGFATEPALPFFLERYANAYRIQLDKFLRVVSGENLELPGGPDGLRALQLADAAQQSLETGLPVKA